MKRLLLLFSYFLLVVALNGCEQSAGAPVSSGSEKKISVVATIFAPYDFTREIAKDQVELNMLLPPASESHSYDPTPQDIIRIQNCDIFIYVGGESDGWADRILTSMDTSGMKIITLMDCVNVVEEEIIAGMTNTEEEEADTAYDEHVWTSPKNAKLIVQKISDALCEVDVINAAGYKENTTAYLESLDALDAAFQSAVDGAVRKTIIFGDRFPFRYFADAYGLDYFAAFPGCAAETEPSAETVAFLIDKVKTENIPVVFHAELSNGKMADTISEETGAKVLLLHACHNITRDDFENSVSYLDLMTQNVEALKRALQ